MVKKKCCQPGTRRDKHVIPARQLPQPLICSYAFELNTVAGRLRACALVSMLCSPLLLSPLPTCPPAYLFFLAIQFHLHPTDAVMCDFTHCTRLFVPAQLKYRDRADSLEFYATSTREQNSANYNQISPYDEKKRKKGRARKGEKSGLHDEIRRSISIIVVKVNLVLLLMKIFR